MSSTKLESYFDRICREKPSKPAIMALEDYPDRRELVEFLLERCRKMLDLTRTAIEWDGRFEWGVINSIPVLCKVDLEASLDTILDILEEVEDDPGAAMHNQIMVSLEGAGESALEPVLRKYNRCLDEVENLSTWVWLLSTLGARDQRIFAAILDYVNVNLSEAIQMMAHYGDESFVPFIEGYVACLARYLNDNKIDPFVEYARLDDPLVDEYIECREALVALKEGYRDDITRDQFRLFDERVEALDRRLLKYVDWEAFRKNARELEKRLKALAAGDIDIDEFIATSPFSTDDDGSKKVGRNEPCPCGSGKKYKNCCGRA